MKRIFIILILLATLTSFTGCADIMTTRNEMENLSFIRVVGIDDLPEKNMVRVTIISKRTVSKKEVVSIPANQISAEGETIFEAVRKLDRYSIKKPFWAHVSYILFGEETAKNGITKYLDFFSAQYQYRLTIRPIIVIGSTAEDLMDTSNTEESFISDKLEQLNKNVNNLSISDNLQLNDVIEMFDRPFISSYIPCILQTEAVHKEGIDSGKKDIIMNGFAIFKNEKMIGYIEGDLAKGLNWVRNRHKSGIIVVKDGAGKNVSLEINNNKTEVTPEINNNKLSVNVKITVVSGIGEMYSNTDAINEKNIKLMEKQQENIIKTQASSIIKYAQENKADMIFVWDSVLHKYPKQWKSMYNNWPDIFSNIPITVEVDSKILRRNVLNIPVKVKELEK